MVGFPEDVDIYKRYAEDGKAGKLNPTSTPAPVFKPKLKSKLKPAQGDVSKTNNTMKPTNQISRFQWSPRLPNDKLSHPLKVGDEPRMPGYIKISIQNPT
ncbi:hypothetical protein N7508_001267 [Penicillium antarcticum]|uniref:uncharacterized protein n=1 Tax=Penicillium antarcticum TaxID=416450 RepID=UPI002385FA42|nr:uncharacterized protein N7508_001267 [Penicillium antarcticum]KAJ5316759.1 hypothetical protein N7508_001267 [Penicillium antarcticum]